MALSIREKKLAVGWLAEVAVTNRLAAEYGSNEVKEAIFSRQFKLKAQILKDFSLSERAELDVLNAQIPKE